MEPRVVAIGFFVALLLIAMILSPVPARASILQPPGVIVPLYSHPGTQWDSVIAAKQANPTVSIIAIINPNSGPGWASDPAYVQGVQHLKSAGIVVLGYVPTNYATQALSTVESWVTNYQLWYGVNGVFFDEMPATPGFESYYQTLNAFAKSLGMQYTVGNPGANLPSSYAGILDIYVVAESSSLVYTSSISGAIGGASPSSLAVIMYSIPRIDQPYVSGLIAAAGYIYATDQGSPNPYNVLSGYFPTLVNMVARASGQTSGSNEVSINTMSTGGFPLLGLYTTVLSNEAAVASGYSPLSFVASLGSTYEVKVSDYGSETFDHWSDGATLNAVSITPGADEVLTAYFNTGSAVRLSVQTVRPDGTVLNGIWTTVAQGSVTVGSGYTPLSVMVTPGLRYNVTVNNFASDIFSHWSTGATSSSLFITPGADTQLTAYYNTQSSATTTSTTPPASSTTTFVQTISLLSTTARTDTDLATITQTFTQVPIGGVSSDARASAPASAIPPAFFAAGVVGTIAGGLTGVELYLRRAGRGSLLGKSTRRHK